MSKFPLTQVADALRKDCAVKEKWYQFCIVLSGTAKLEDVDMRNFNNGQAISKILERWIKKSGGNATLHDLVMELTIADFTTTAGILFLLY